MNEDERSTAGGKKKRDTEKNNGELSRGEQKRDVQKSSGGRTRESGTEENSDGLFKKGRITIEVRSTGKTQETAGEMSDETRKTNQKE